MVILKPQTFLILFIKLDTLFYYTTPSRVPIVNHYLRFRQLAIAFRNGKTRVYYLTGVLNPRQLNQNKALGYV